MSADLPDEDVVEENVESGGSAAPMSSPDDDPLSAACGTCPELNSSISPGDSNSKATKESDSGSRGKAVKAAVDYGTFPEMDRLKVGVSVSRGSQSLSSKHDVSTDIPSVFLPDGTPEPPANHWDDNSGESVINMNNTGDDSGDRVAQVFTEKGPSPGDGEGDYKEGTPDSNGETDQNKNKAHSLSFQIDMVVVEGLGQPGGLGGAPYYPEGREIEADSGRKCFCMTRCARCMTDRGNVSARAGV